MSEEHEVTPARRTGLVVFAWLWVGLPFAYGVYELILKVIKLFGG